MTPDEFPNEPEAPDMTLAAGRSESAADPDTLVALFLATFHGTAAQATVRVDAGLATALGHEDAEGTDVVLDRLKRTVATTRGKVLVRLPDDLFRLEEGGV